MAYQIYQIVEGKGPPVSVTKNDSVSTALSLMIEHDYSQLPVVSREEKAKDMVVETAEGMITNESILRGIRNFKTNIEYLSVRDVMVSAPIHSFDDDLFDILDRLKDSNAVLITEDIGLGANLVGIVTSYDATEYFRTRTEDMMRVEDIELIIKEFIRTAYTNDKGEIIETDLNSVISLMTSHRQTDTPLDFDDLSLGEYVNMLVRKQTWGFFEPIFNISRDSIIELLNGIRETRNELAHFRGDITAEQRDRLRFASDWLSKRQEEYQNEQERLEEIKRIDGLIKKAEEKTKTLSAETSESDKFSVAEVVTGGGRYAALADWLQSQPGDITKVQLSFSDIEEIIDAKLPASARDHRAWWANDSVGHRHSQQWLEAGWRSSYLNMTEGKVTFVRTQERQQAYIDFFSKLLTELREKTELPIRDVSPGGSSWIGCCPYSSKDRNIGQFGFCFVRSNGFRIELYIDSGDKEVNKKIFDLIQSHRENIEDSLDEISWERIDQKRASRIAIYHPGTITDSEEELAALRNWGVKTMLDFYKLVEPIATEAAKQVLTE